ncbi:unnamed protein product [Closterium sp. NIES-53]
MHVWAKIITTVPEITGSGSDETGKHTNGNGVAAAPTDGEGVFADGNGHCDHIDLIDRVDCVDSVDQGGGEKQPAVMSVASMMLDAQADLLDSLERPEILSIIDGLTPPMERPKLVVELGAGIGRFTADLACRATWLTALDFLPHALAAVSPVCFSFELSQGFLRCTQGAKLALPDFDCVGCVDCVDCVDLMDCIELQLTSPFPTTPADDRTCKHMRDSTPTWTSSVLTWQMPRQPPC